MNRSALALALILTSGFALRLRAANHPYISQWDEAYHALVAKNLVVHPLTPILYEDKVLPSDDREWTKAGVWLHKPPLPLWLMAAGIAAFGDGELSFRAASVALDTLTILLVFLLADECFGRKRRPAGLLAAAVYAVNPLMIRLVSGRVPDDAPHVVNVFFITLTVYLFAVAARKNGRVWAAAAGASLGLGTLCMTGVAMLGLAVPLPLLAARGARGFRRLLISAGAAFLALALPWPLYALHRWPELWRHESALQAEHLFKALEGHAHAWWWYASLVPVHYGGSVAAVAVIAALAYAAREARSGGSDGTRAALIWALLPYAFFSVIATKLYSYPCAAVPGMALLAGLAGAALWSKGRGARVAVVAALLAAAVPRLAADYSICPWSDRYDYPTLRRAALALREIPGPKVLLNVGDGKAAQATYYSGASAYPDAPTPDVVRSLIGRGYRIFVFLDEETRDAAFLPALKKAGLDKKVRYYFVPAPIARDPKHPYEA